MVLATAAASVNAQEAARSEPPQRYRSVSLKPGEKCPASVGDEVVVCGTLEDPYRIPKQFRHTTIPPQNQSWVNRAALVDEVSRVAGGLPDTCSPVGTGGQSGCGLAAMRAWTAERREMQREAASIP